MPLPLTSVHAAKKQRQGVSGDSADFDSAFINAASLGLLDIQNSTPSLAPNLISSVNSDTGLTIRYLPMIDAGVDYYMSVNSQFKREGTADLFQIYQNALSFAATYDREDNSTIKGRRGVAVG